jgi:3-demethoxyubiquinol 3-hydroxylase
MRYYSSIDRIITRVDKLFFRSFGVRNDVFGDPANKSQDNVGLSKSQTGKELRVDPANKSRDDKKLNNSRDEEELSKQSDRHHARSFDSQLSLSLMRVNHSGEICAQALYHGQALMARDPELETRLKEAAEEEQSHLDWCEKRILALGGKTSLLNPFWTMGSFGIGAIAGLLGDKISLGFIAETEHQVTAHIDKHLELLPKEDQESREILLKMREDECRHATNAIENGGVPLPFWARSLMAATAKVMTITARYI